jgi:phage repressor protein C with HTH and peptisase S24 domain
MNPVPLGVKSFLSEAPRPAKMVPMGDTTDPGNALVLAAIALARAKGIGKGALASKAGLNRSHLGRVEKGERGLSLAAAVSLASVVDATVDRLLGEAPAPPSSGVTVRGEDFATLPLVAEGVAAGFGAVAEVLDEPRPYAFRADWPALKGMAADPLRFVLFRLRDDADSMSPEIRPKALVLCDRSEGERISPRNGVPYLVVTERPNHVAVKRVLPVRDGEKIRALVYHSTNPHYPPTSIDLKRGERMQDLVRACVVWWATETD